MVLPEQQVERSGDEESRTHILSAIDHTHICT